MGNQTYILMDICLTCTAQQHAGLLWGHNDWLKDHDTSYCVLLPEPVLQAVFYSTGSSHKTLTPIE